MTTNLTPDQQLQVAAELRTLTAHQRLGIAAEGRGMTDRQAAEHRREHVRLFYQSSRGEGGESLYRYLLCERRKREIRADRMITA